MYNYRWTYLFLTGIIILYHGNNMLSTYNAIRLRRLKIIGGSGNNPSISVLTKEICEQKKLRFLTLGRSNAEGIGLGTEDVAYPKLLCDGDVLAGEFNNTGEFVDSSMLARHLHRMIGDEIYDVIVLDFFEETSCYDGRLQYRLKKRFPNATVINLQAYLIGWTMYYESDDFYTVSDWAYDKGFESLSDDALSAFSDSTQEWKIFPFDDQYYMWDKMNKEFNSAWLTKENLTIYSNMTSNNIKDLLIRRSYLYNDWELFNNLGHHDIAQAILGLAKTVHATYNNTVIGWDENEDDATYECQSCFLLNEVDCNVAPGCKYNETSDTSPEVNCSNDWDQGPEITRKIYF